MPLIEGAEGQRAAELYERIFVGYGDDSVAQLGGAHIACEWTSNLLTKILQRPRLAAYLEQSTRYIAYDAQLEGYGYRYHRDARFGQAYEHAMDDLFATYARLLEDTSAWVAERFPAGEGESPAAHRRAVRAKALDLVRGLLPAASLSHVGMYASGQTYEQLVLHLLAHPLAEARAYGSMLLEELQHIIPSFVSRVPRDDRGGRWIDFLRERRAAADTVAARLGLESRAAEAGPSVRLLRAHGTEEELLAALVYESSALSEDDALHAVARLGAGERAALVRELVGTRENRRHRPGRGFETLRYRFEIVSDYGAFRDLQRHRLLTCQWQRLTPDLGADVPHELGAAGLGGEFERALESRAASTSACAATASPRRRRTRSASPSASDTCSGSTRARRSTSSSSGRDARAIPHTARSRTRCGARSRTSIRPSPRRCRSSTTRPRSASRGFSPEMRNEATRG